MKLLIPLFCLLTVTAGSQMSNWYDSEAEESFFSISTDKAYGELLRGRKAEEVIVAIIDSGVEPDHDDLKEVMWVNEDEIPDNGIDDDQNGYIDDIHGWNFLGNAKGENVDYDTYELTRLFAIYRKKYGSLSSDSGLGDKERVEYSQFNEWKKKIDVERTSAKKQLDQFEKSESFLMNVITRLEDYLESDVITTQTIDSLKLSGERELIIGANILESVKEQLGKIPKMSELKRDISSEFISARAHYTANFGYHYNPDFDSRNIVGDNYTDPYERYYGNNDVEGPDAMHGTHVAGIVAAKRDNNIGINGVAHNARIMSIRAVPDGDERDKDVANAIIYAVDNGAKVINMSFGKGFSPEKHVVDKAVRYAEKNDVLLVHAAGNGSTNNDTHPNFPNDTYKKGFGFLFFKKKRPKNWLEVGASSSSKDESVVAPFSNYGKNEVDLFAPGMNMMATVPDNGYQVLQGTSMAAPVVSGIAAVLRGYFPQLKAKEIKSILMESAMVSDKEVVVPGENDSKVPFSELSVSGGAVNLYLAMKYANRVYKSGHTAKSSKSKKSNKKAATEGPVVVP